MKSLFKIAITATLFFMSNISFAQDGILGKWFNEEKTSQIEVYKENGKYYGKIIWLKDNKNPDGTSPRKDYNNPDSKMKQRDLIGTIILKDLKWDADDKEWNEGEIYDPKSGKTYSLFGRIESDGTLFLKGYIGFSLIGRSTIWTRAK